MAASKDGDAECCGAPYSAACNANAILRAVFDECTYIRVIPWISPNLEYWDGPCSNSDAYRYDGAARYCGDDWDMYVADGNACLYTEENGVKILEVEPGETAVRIGTNSEAGGYWHHTWRHQEAVSQLPGSEGKTGEPVRWYGADATLDSSSSVTVHLYFGPAFGAERPVYDQTLPPMVRESLSVTVSGGPAQVRFGQEGCVCNLGGHHLPFLLGEAGEAGGTFGYGEFWQEPERTGGTDIWDRLEIQPLPGYRLDSVTWAPSDFFPTAPGYTISRIAENGAHQAAVDLPAPIENRTWQVQATVAPAPVAEVRVFSDPAQGRAFIRSKPLSGPRSDGCPAQYASGVYNVGDQILLRAIPKNCETFSHWEDGNGNVLSEEEDFLYTVPDPEGEGKSGTLDTVVPSILVTANYGKRHLQISKIEIIDRENNSTLVYASYGSYDAKRMKDFALGYDTYKITYDYDFRKINEKFSTPMDTPPGIGGTSEEIPWFCEHNRFVTLDCINSSSGYNDTSNYVWRRAYCEDTNYLTTDQGFPESEVVSENHCMKGRYRAMWGMPDDNSRIRNLIPGVYYFHTGMHYPNTSYTDPFWAEPRHLEIHARYYSAFGGGNANNVDDVADIIGEMGYDHRNDQDTFLKSDLDSLRGSSIVYILTDGALGTVTDRRFLKDDDDNLVEPEDIAALGLHCRLVVLNACYIMGGHPNDPIPPTYPDPALYYQVGPSATEYLGAFDADILIGWAYEPNVPIGGAQVSFGEVLFEKLNNDNASVLEAFINTRKSFDSEWIKAHAKMTHRDGIEPANYYIKLNSGE